MLSCTGPKGSSSSGLARTSNSLQLPFRITIETNLFEDSIRAYIESQLKEKGYKVLDRKEYAKLVEEHYKENLRRLDPKKHTPKELTDAIDSGKEYADMIWIRSNVQQGKDERLEFKTLTYKIFTVASKTKTDHIPFDLSSSPDPSLKPICTELVRILIEAKGK
jgi:hypothetical protein